MEGKEGKENHVYMQAGVLSTIEYPTGGSVRIDYEPNRFYDPVGGGEFYGGGLRVKKLTKSDGLGLANDNSEYYIYTLNGQNEGRSSAVLLNRPEYIVNTEMYYNPDGTYERYSTFSNLTGLQLWRRLIVRSFDDLQSEENSLTIGYQKVTVREQGKGHTEFVYKIPAKYGDESAPNWSATKSFIAREMPSRQSGTFLALAPTPITYSMPFGYQLIVGQQHGLLESVKSYSEAGNLVKSATYRYIEKGAPVFVKGLKLSQIKVPFSFVEPFNGSTVISSENAYRYNHYAIRYGTVIRIEEEQEVLYDPVNAANSNLTTKRSFYEGANHNFVTREELINDQGTYRTYYKYADDLAYAAPAADVYTQNLKRLLSLNYRGALVESYSSMQVGGLSAKVVSGNVLLYKQLPSTQMVVDQVLSLKQFPLSSYTPAAITISNNQAKLNYDTQYKTEQRFESFDPLGNPINILGSDRIWRGAVRSYNYQVPVLDFSGVKAEELRYDDFESDYLNVGLIPDKRWYANPAMFTTGRFGGRAIYFENNTASVPRADQTLSRSFTKRENLYHFAAWIKSTSTGSFTLAFSTSAGSSSVIVNFPNTDNEWALLRENISITPAGPTINLKLTSTGNVALDDVLLIPRSADYIQRTYDMPHGPAAVTDHNSKTSYFEYDELGRPVITRNDNKEIVATQSYKTPRVTGEWDPDFTVTNAYVDEQTVFSAVPKFDDAQYYWSINGSEVSGVDIYKYTFKTSGSHKVQLRMVRGAVTKYSLEKVINLTYRPLKVQLCVDGPVVYDKCKNEALVLSACDSGAGTTGPATTFIASFSGTSQAVGYEWWIKHEYDIYWTKIDGASSSTYQTFRNSSFQIRCTVGNSNVKGTSLPENVKVVGDTPCTEQ
ncbi:MAG: hypothetical protein KY428_01425 [Bacteroidetes bacterium]|nr:hypothetical protein [Bacteroidota bacterium]